MQIAGVVDWEFTYAAPAEFSYAPPWWLLTEEPEYQEKGIEDWTTISDYRLKTFLGVMKDCEDTAIQQGRLNENQRLSGPIQGSWESGDFWIVYAVLHSFAFDVIYWLKIDLQFFEGAESPEEAWREDKGNYVEADADGAEPLGISGTDTISASLSRSYILVLLGTETLPMVQSCKFVQSNAFLASTPGRISADHQHSS